MRETSSSCRTPPTTAASRARRVSPFVLEALDLPSSAGTPGAGARRPLPLDQLQTFEPRPAPPEPPLEPITEPLTLSFGQIDDYLTCPRKYRYLHVLRVPVAPHHAMIYGSALHRAVQEFHRRHARGDVMSEAELIDAFEVAWRNEGFLTREHEEARLEAGRAALRRFRTEQLEPGAVIPAYVEREFAFCVERRPDQGPLGPGRHRAGRAGECRRAGPTAAGALKPGGGTVAVMEPDVVGHDAAASAARAGHDHRLQVERRPRPGRGAPAGAGFAPADDLRAWATRP